MKLIQINASYKPAFIYGGPTMSISKLSEVLVSKNTLLEVLTTTANGEKEVDIISGSTVFVENVPVTYYKRLTKDHTHFSPALYFGLWKKLKKTNALKSQNPMVVHIHTWWNLVSVFSCMLAILKNVPVVLSPRGTLSAYSFGNRNNLIKNLIYRISKPFLKRCHFHVTSDNEKRAVLALLNPKSITVIPNLVSLAENELEVVGSGLKEDGVQVVSCELKEGNGSNKRKSNVFKFLFLSRIEEKKGLELLFAALTDIALKFHLSIAGSGEEEYVNQLKTLSTSLEIEDKISWIGQQSAEKKFDLMAAHDLLILPSYDENFANVVIESLAMGTAVLISENVGLSDYVKEQDLGWVCKFDQEDLRYSLIQAAKDSIKLGRIKETAPGKIREDFSDDKLIKRYIEMYRRIAEEAFS